MAIKLVLAGIAAAASIAGGVMASRSYRQAAKTEEQVGTYNQTLAERDAQIKEQQAREIGQVNLLDRLDDAREFADLQAGTEMALSHNGWMLEGTPALQLAYNADEFEKQQQRNDYAMRVNADAQREAAVQDRLRGNLEKLSASSRAQALRVQATQSLLGGASKAASIGMKG